MVGAYVEEHHQLRRVDGKLVSLEARNGNTTFANDSPTVPCQRLPKLDVRYGTYLY